MSYEHLAYEGQEPVGLSPSPVSPLQLLSLTNLHIARALAIVYGEHEFAIRISQDIEAIETAADAAVRASVAANAPGIWNSH